MANDSDRMVHDPKGGMPRLLEIMRRLRDPDGGCPWDLEQSFETIAPYTLEEAHEVVDAIRTGDRDELADELGDLLLQVIYHAQMASEEGSFDVSDVIRRISDKMVRRHPHVFGDESREKSSEQQTADWEAIKAAERAAKGATETPRTLDGIALALPGLTRAVKLRFDEEGITIPYPQRDVHIQGTAPA